MDFRENLNRKWRWELFKICVLLAAIGTVAEIAIYLYDSANSVLFLPLSIYRARFIYIPSSLNLIIILLTAYCLKSPRLSNGAKNVWACILIYFLCANTQVIHYVYGPLLMLPSVAIFVTILFANKWLTAGISIASVISLAIAGFQASRELRKDDPRLTIDLILAFVVMFTVYVSARLLSRYVKEQIDYILVSNERQRTLIEERNIDPLLGIGNRRVMNERLAEIVNTAKGSVAPQLLMLDVDDFKSINDIYGHLSGDEVLTKLSDMIRKQIKENRLEAFRYGGEEIVLVSLGIGGDEAFTLFDELRKGFSRMRYSFELKRDITFSGGMVALTAGMKPEEWLKSADDMLYIAKSDGKNRIHRAQQNKKEK